MVRRGHGVGGCGGQLGALRLGAVDGGDERSDGRERGCRARAFGGRNHQGAATPEYRRRPACSSAPHVTVKLAAATRAPIPYYTS